MRRNVLLGLSFLLTLLFLASCEDMDDFEDYLDDELLEERAISIVATYQAENRTSASGCTIATNHPGFTGTGFVDYGGNGSLVEWNNINAPSAGKYELKFRYANGSGGPRQCIVTVNDTTSVGNVAFAPTGAWTTWSTVSINANLKAGNNKIRVTANTGSGGPNLDKVDLISTDGGGGNTSGCAEVAENQSAKLSCPSGQVITAIDFASYGVPTGSCSAGFSIGKCHSSTSKSKMQALCLNKQSCTVGANNKTFGDPCVGTFKKLAVVFSCGTDGGEDGGGGGASKCADAAERSNATLSCPSGQNIGGIDFASYGLPTGSCPGGFRTGNCHADSSLDKVNKSCLGKPSCTVAASNSVFGDPCPGKAKKLAIVYTCGGGADSCPNDPNKTSPGICGCGVADTDTDKDGIADCKDGCKSDPKKTTPGKCGCGRPEGSCTVVIPDPLPDPDNSPPNTTKPVKVYILSGQSNMVGMGQVSADLPGTLATLTRKNGKFPYLIDNSGNWTVRNDVWYKGVVTATANKWLTVGCGANSDKIGPELGFGHVMGFYHDEPVIIIKASQGNRSLAWDILPPGSERYKVDGRTYAGYGDGDDSWSDQDPYKDIETWYAGKQYDDYVKEIHKVLDNFATLFPAYKNQGYEIAGFAWFQGHKDAGNTVHANRYEINLVNFIKAIRAEFKVPKAPFVIATIGFDGWKMTGNQLIVANAQLAVSGEKGKYPEFAGNVLTVESRDFWREVSISPMNQGYHYNQNAETYMLIGDALGRAMVTLIAGK